MKATIIKRQRTMGGYRLYCKVNPRITREDGVRMQHIIVSMTKIDPSGWETHIFEANDDSSTVRSWDELEGSKKGKILPEDLLRELGYEVDFL